MKHYKKVLSKIVNNLVLSILLKTAREDARCSSVGSPFQRNEAMTKKAMLLVDDFLAFLRVTT